MLRTEIDAPEVQGFTETATTTRPTSSEIKLILEKEFGIGHIMVEIARCESVGWRQWDKDGNVLRGKQNKQDVGLFQINEYYHLEESIRLGYDIYTLNGNIGYARYIYDRQGTRPWNWSRDICWGKTL